MSFRLPILCIVLISLIALMVAAVIRRGNFWPWWYWRQNVSLIKAGWSMIKLFRRHDLFEKDTEEKDDATRLNEQGEFFQQFCVQWAGNAMGKRMGEDRGKDEKLVESVSKIPLEYAIFANISDEQLGKNWHKFVSNKCYKYYDKLMCANGLVFDWKTGKVGKK